MTRCSDVRPVGAELQENSSGDAFAFANKSEEDVLRTDLVVPELERLPHGEFEGLLRPGRERDETSSRRLAAGSDDLLDL